MTFSIGIFIQNMKLFTWREQTERGMLAIILIHLKGEIWYFDHFRLNECSALVLLMGRLRLMNDRVVLEKPWLLSNGHPNQPFRSVFVHWQRSDYTPIDKNWQALPRVEAASTLVQLPETFVDPATLRVDCQPRSYALSPLYNYRWGENIDLVGGTSFAVTAEKGWSVGEPTHRWTDGKKMEVLLADAPHATHTIHATLSAAPFTYPPKVMIQRVTVSVNDEIVGHLSVDHGEIGKFGDYNFTIPAHTWNAAAPVRLQFDLPDAFSPKSVGLSGDKRLLGLAVDKLRFDQ